MSACWDSFSHNNFPRPGNMLENCVSAGRHIWKRISGGVSIVAWLFTPQVMCTAQKCFRVVCNRPPALPWFCLTHSFFCILFGVHSAQWRELPFSYRGGVYGLKVIHTHFSWAGCCGALLRRDVPHMRAVWITLCVVWGQNHKTISIHAPRQRQSFCHFV